jgi:hypothetical protein
VFPLDCVRNTKSAPPSGLIPAKTEVGSKRAALVGKGGKEIGARGERVEAISNRLRNVWGADSSGGCERIGSKVSAENNEGIPFSCVGAESERIKSTERSE